MRVPGSLALVLGDRRLRHRSLDVSGLPADLRARRLDGKSVVLSATTPCTRPSTSSAEHGKSLAATGGTPTRRSPGLLATCTAPARARQVLALRRAPVGRPPDARRSNPASDPEDRGLRGAIPTSPASSATSAPVGVVTRLHVRRDRGAVLRGDPEDRAEVDSVLSDLDATSARYDFWRGQLDPEDRQRAPLGRDADPQGPERRRTATTPRDASENILSCLFQVHGRGLDGRDRSPAQPAIVEAVYHLIKLHLLQPGEQPGDGDRCATCCRSTSAHRCTSPWRSEARTVGTSGRSSARASRAYFDTAGWPNIPTEIELSRTTWYWMSPGTGRASRTS